MEDSYWSSILRQRLSRRRALAMTGGTAAAAALLAACGGGDGDNNGSSRSSLLGDGGDSTSKAVGGGTMIDATTTQITHMDAVINTSTATLTQLMMNATTLLNGGISTSTTRPGLETVTGGSAEKWEISPDLMQVTLKVRPNHKFDPRPPTNGRAMTSEDVKWSWDKYVRIGASSGDVANEKGPNGPILNVTTPDASTVVMKLAFPFGLIGEVLSSYQHFYIAPRDDTFDFRAGMRGAGPYFLDDYQPSIGFFWKKNPDYFEKGQPFLDRIERYIVPDYAAGLAQFTSKKLWYYEVLPNNVVPTKQNFPEMVLLQLPGLENSAHVISYSTRENSPFKDVRLRRALSMVLDRDLLVNVLFELEQYERAGLPADKAWNSHINAAHAGWIDPAGNGLGEGAKYFQQNLPEAKKLLEAAGVKLPLQSTYTYFTDPPKDGKENLIIQTMMNDSGLFDLKSEILDYTSSWRTASDAHGKGHDGVLYNRSATTSADQNLVQLYTPTGRSAVWDTEIPGVADLVQKQRIETDAGKRNELIKQAQQKLALEWPAILFPGQSRLYRLSWPWLRNYAVFNEGNPSGRQNTRWWYDASKQS